MRVLWICLFLVGCHVSGEDIHKAIRICKTNKGLERIEIGFGTRQAFCNNSMSTYISVYEEEK